MSAVAKRIVIIASIIAGILAIVGGTMAIVLNRPSNVVARSDRLETPTIRGVEKEGDDYLLSFSYIPDATGYMVTEYNPTTNERHTQSYKGDAVQYAGEYVKVRITDFLFNTHTEVDFRDYTFTATAKYSDQVFNSKESQPYVYKNQKKLASPIVKEINPNSISMKWDSVEYATSYNVYLDDGDENTNDAYISTIETYLPLETIKSTFGEKENYTLYVIAKNQSVSLQGYILDSDPSEGVPYLPAGKLSDIVLTFDKSTKTLSFNKVVGATNYLLYLSTFGTTAYTTKNDSPNLFSITNDVVTCNLSGIECANYLGTIITYIEAVSSNQNISSSTSNQIKYINERKLQAPSNIKIASDDTYMQVSWTASDDAAYTTGYTVWAYKYTAAQVADQNVLAAPQNYDVARSAGFNTSTTMVSIQLDINIAGYYGIALIARAPSNSQYVDSDIVYYKNEDNLNFYDAHKVLPAPTGIIASENEDGTIAVSWNIVENARRYLVKLESADGLGTSSKVFAAVDNREEINRVNTRIPPQVIDSSELIPGKYKVSVRTESGVYLTSDLEYNTSVSYPEGQDYVAYRIPFDMSGVNLYFNPLTKTLSWQSIEDASFYDVYAYVGAEQPKLVGTSTNTSYEMTEFFADYHNDTGLYNLYIVAKAGAGVYRTPSKSNVVQYNFVQSYQPPTNLSVTDEGLNGRKLEWQTSINKTASTTYTVLVNGNVVADDISGTFVDITNNLLLGANVISIYANADDMHLQSSEVVVNCEYNFVLSQISGDISVVASAVAYSTPNVSLVFNSVQNAQGYNVNINNQGNTLYTTYQTTAGVVTIPLTAYDVEKLNAFETNVIAISPSNQGETINNNIIVPDGIAKSVEFANTYYLPALSGVNVLTNSLSTNIVSKISNPTINIQFTPLDLQSANSVYTNVKPVNKYLITVYKVGQSEPINTYVADISSIVREGDGSVKVNIFDAFIQENGTSLYVGDLIVFVSAYVNSPNEVVGVPVFDEDVLTIALGLGEFDEDSIDYNETEEGMMLSWASVENATSYDVTVAGETIGGIVAQDGDVQTLDLQPILYNKTIGNYATTITAKLNASTETATKTINVVKKLIMHQVLLTSNNTVLTINQADLPSTLYDGGVDGAVVATHLVLLFDNAEAAELYSTNPTVLQNYTYKIVDLTAITPVNEVYSIDISEFSSVQTCFIYAYNANNLASISDYIILDVGGAVQYSDPILSLEIIEGNILAQWRVEYLNNNEVPTAPNYDLDVLMNDKSLVNAAFLASQLQISAYDADNQLIADGATLSIENGKLKATIANAFVRSIIVQVANLTAGNYVFKLQAITQSRAYANSSNIVEESITLTKTISKPITRFVPYDLITSQYYDDQNTLDMSNVNIDDYTGHPFKIYVTNPTFDGLALSTVAVRMQKDGVTIIDQDIYQLKTDATYGKYITLDKLSMGIYTTGNYTILLKYVSPNPVYYQDSDYTTVRNIEVTTCELDLSITNVVFTDGVAIDDGTGFEITWQNNRVYPIGSIYSLKLYPLSDYVLGGDNSSVIAFSDSGTLAYNINYARLKINDNNQYVVEFEIETNVTPADETAYSLTTYTNNQYKNIYLVKNNTKQFVYDSTNDTLTINLDNKIALNNPTTIVLNGLEYAIATSTLNSITFANGSTVISALQPGLGNDATLVPPADRRVTVMVYKADELLYNDDIDEFPVFVPQYANGVQLINDTLLYWNAVQYATSYNVHISNAVDSYVYSATTNSISLLDLSDIHGGLYNVYVEVVALVASNVFVTSRTPTPVPIEYLEPYNTVFGVTYTESLAGQNFDITANDEVFQYEKTLSWQIDTTGTYAPVDPQNNAMFLITLNGPTAKALKAVSSGAYAALSQSLPAEELANYIIFNNNLTRYSIDLTDIFNNAMVGEYSISVVITHLQSVASQNDYRYRLQSKPSTSTFTNHKVMSIPSVNIWDYIKVNPDSYVVIDATTGMATAQAGREEDLVDRIITFNHKAFVVNTPFDYATSININIHSQTSTLGSVNLNNALNATGSTDIIASDTSYTVVVTLYLDENTENLGLFEYYYVPTLTELGNDAIGVITVDGNARAISREYTLNTYISLEIPTYNLNTVEPNCANGESGENINTLTVTNPDVNNTSYLVNIYPNILSGGVNTPDGYNQLVCASTYSTVVTLASNNQISLNDVLEDLNLPFGKYWVSLSRLSTQYLEATDLFAISSFQGEPVQFDYHYALGDILDAEYDDDGVYTLSWSLLDVEEVTPVKYYVTINDQSGNEITYWCVVSYANSSYSITLASDDGELFAINNNKLTFFVDNFVRNTERGDDYYLVGNYGYAIVATDDIDEVMNSSNSSRPQPTVASANNIISSAEASGNFVYQIVYPVAYSTATLEGNVLSWSAVDESGLNLSGINHVWQYRLANGNFINLNDVTETFASSNISCSTEIMLDYTTRTEYKNTMVIRLLISNEPNFLYDTVGKKVEVDTKPQLPGFASFKLDTNKADGSVRYVFDNKVINNSKSGTAYYVGDLDNQVLNLGLDFELTFNGQTVVLPNKGGNINLASYYETITTQYKQLNGNTNLIQLMTTDQKAHFTQTINGVTEFIPGVYKLKLKLYDRSSTPENTKYLFAESEEQTINIVSRWQTGNVSLSGENITYYSQLKDANGEFSKLLNKQTSVNWVSGMRNTVLDFDITNPDKNATGLSITLWLLEYSTEYQANNCNLVVPADRANRCLTYDISSVISEDLVWHVNLNITELWQTVTLPREYFVGFYISESKNSAGTEIRRKSLSSSHNDQLNSILGTNDPTARNFAIINYKDLPTVNLLNYFEYDNNDETIICWTENKVGNDSFSYDVSIVEMEYTTSWAEKGKTYSAKRIRPNAIVRPNAQQNANVIYQSYSTKKLTDLTDAAYYKVTVAVSDNTPDSYYIGKNNDDNLAEAKSQKMYMFLNVYNRPKNADIYAYNQTGVRAELNDMAEDHNGLGVNIGIEDDNAATRAIVIVDEDKDPDSQIIDIKFTQEATASRAYCITVLDNNGNIVKTYYVGRINNHSSLDLYLYYNADADGAYYTQADVVNNASIFIRGNPVGKIVKNGNNYDITINKLSLSQLFGNAYNNGADYTLKINAFIPVYFHKYNAQQLDNANVGINPRINEYNKVNTRALRYYIKFKAPTITNVSVEQKPVGSDEYAATDVVENRNGEYIYRLKIDLDENSIGSSTDSKMVAIYLDGNLSLNNMYFVPYASIQNNTIYIEIKDNNTGYDYNKFRNLVNTRLPNELTFRAIMLPLYGEWKNYAQNISPKSNINSYKDSNELIINNNINSLVTEQGAKVKIGIQLPNVPFAVYLNNKSEESAQNNIKMASIGKDGTYTNLYNPENATNTKIAVDPYLGLNTNITINNRTRSYLYNEANASATNNENFTTTGKFNINLTVYDRASNNQLGVIYYANAIDVVNLLNIVKDNNIYTIPQNNNLYSKLVTICPNGGAIKLGIQLVYVGLNANFTDSNKVRWAASETTFVDLNFYVRDNQTYTLALKTDWDSLNDLSYLNKADLQVPTVEASINNSTDYTLFVKMYATYNFITPYTTTPYYFEVSLANNSDVTTWVTTLYANNCLNLTDTTKANFLMYSLIGADGNGADWHIEYTVLKQQENSFVCSSYLGNSLAKVTQTEVDNQIQEVLTPINVFTPQIKLKTPSTIVTYKGDSQDTLSLSSKFSDGTGDLKNLYQKFALSTDPTFNNINRTARYIQILSLNNVSTTNDESAILSILNSGETNAFNRADTKLNKENAQSFIESLKTYINNKIDDTAELAKTGQYTISYRYVYYGFGKNGGNAIVQPSSSELSFVYTKYELVYQQYHALSVKDGKIQTDAALTTLSDGVKEALGRIGNGFVDTEVKGSTEDGILIICDKPQTGYMVYFYQLVYDEGSEDYVPTFTSLTLDANNRDHIKNGQTTDDAGNSYTYYYIRFDPSNADCLDDNDYGDNAAIFAEGFHTKYAGYLQGGKNSFYVIAQDLNANFDPQKSNIYTLYSIGGSAITASHSSIKNEQPRFQLQTDEYLKFGAAQATPNTGSVTSWNDDKITKLDGGMNTTPVHLDKPCSPCNGTGYTIQNQSHRYVCVSSYALYNSLGVAISYICVYKCAYCGSKTQKPRFIWEDHSKGHQIYEGSGCWRRGTCEHCGGSGTDPHAKVDTYIYNALTVPNSFGVGQTVVSWVFEQGNDSYIYENPPTNTIIIGRKIRVLCKNNMGNVNVFTATLMIGQTLQTVNLYTQYNFRLKYGNQAGDVIRATSKDTPITINQDASSFTAKYYYTMALESGYSGDYTVSLEPKEGFKDCFVGNIPSTSKNTLSINQAERTNNIVSWVFSENNHALLFNLNNNSPLYLDDINPVVISYDTYIARYHEGKDVGAFVRFQQGDDKQDVNDALFPGMQIGIDYNVTVSFNVNKWAHGISGIFGKEGFDIDMSNNVYCGTDYSMLYPPESKMIDPKDPSNIIRGYEISLRNNYQGSNFVDEWVAENIGDGDYKGTNGKIRLKLYNVPYANASDPNTYVYVGSSQNDGAGLNLFSENIDV